MPNWVCNHLIIHGENAIEIMRSLLIKNENSDCDYDLDFNKIIPMPEALNIISGSTTNDCAKLFINAMLEGCDAYAKYAGLYVKAFGKNFYMSETEQAETMKSALRYKDHESDELLFKTKADVYAYGKRALDNYAKYGAKDWYDWSIQNWGTKWNACHTQINDINEPNIYFDTAWSPPLPVINELSKKYPDLRFEFAFAEEQAGISTGDMVVQNGEIIKGGFFDDDSKEAYETFFELWGMEDEFRFNEKTGTYEYIDNEEAM